MKLYIYILGVYLIGLFLISCDAEEFLENTNKSSLTEQTQWASEVNADIFLNDIYSEIPNKWNFSEHLDYYTDDYNISHYYTASNWRQGICQVPPSSTTNEWGGTQGPTDGFSWATFFSKVRKCNTFIQKLNEYRDNFSEEYFQERTD